GSSTSTEPYVKGLGTGNRYRSPASKVYIAVILPKGQVMNIDKVELDFNDVDWLNVEVDGEAGWTPRLEFLPNGNILIAYSDFNAGNPLAAVLDRSLDPSVPENWVVGDMNSAGPGLGIGQDVIIGPSGTPRISLAYTAISSSSFNTLMGY